jgi:hypothetical protein
MSIATIGALTTFPPFRAMAMTMKEQPGCQLAFSCELVELHSELTLRDDTQLHSGHL